MRAIAQLQSFLAKVAPVAPSNADTEIAKGISYHRYIGFRCLDYYSLRDIDLTADIHFSVENASCCEKIGALEMVFAVEIF